MSVQLNGSTIKVFRDEEDKYFTYLSGNIYNMITRETEGKFYCKRKIKFLNNQEVKNKSKIKIIDGFLAPYRIKVKDENNKYANLNGEVYYIKEFELIEDGILEKQKVMQSYNKQSKAPIDKNTEKLNSFSFNEYGNVTPF